MRSHSVSLILSLAKKVSDRLCGHGSRIECFDSFYVGSPGSAASVIVLRIIFGYSFLGFNQGVLVYSKFWFRNF